MPRPRYSLAALFLVVTVVGCWLGYSVKWIEDRRAFLTREGVTAGREFNGPGGWSYATKTAPGLLWLFGEVGQITIVTDQGDAETGQRLFPEAMVLAGESPLWADGE